ncbi:MAG TPA: Na+/H+ antiporter [Streptosporangiales bacterium]
MLGLELVVVLAASVIVAGVAAPYLRVAAPILLLVIGAVLGFVPALREVSLPPEVMLLVFLPALLYWESLSTSLREMRRMLRSIILMSTLLVVATAAAVAAVAHTFGLPWGPAWVLGAALAPTDATAVGVIARHLPRRLVTILRAESLVNDGTALVIYGVAVGVTAGAERLSALHVTGLFALSVVGGFAAGLVTAWLARFVYRRLDHPLQENAVSVLTPFVAFLLAEAIHASGVLAVVVAGLGVTRFAPRVIRADARQSVFAFWRLSTFLLNGALFVLVGLQLQSSVRGLTSVPIPTAVLGVVGVSLTVVGTRLAWMFTSPYVLRALDRRPVQRTRRVGARARIVSATSGFRGAVSLAAALAVPEVTAAGGPFPYRDLIVFVVSGTIVATLVIQGLALPWVIRWARLPADTDVTEERELAERLATEEAMAAMPVIAERLGTDDDVLKRTRAEYEKHLRVAQTEGVEPEDADHARRHRHDYAELRLALIAHKRETMLRLRDEQRIDDLVLGELQNKLDVEEVRLARRDAEA